MSLVVGGHRCRLQRLFLVDRPRERICIAMVTGARCVFLKSSCGLRDRVIGGPQTTIKKHLIAIIEHRGGFSPCRAIAGHCWAWSVQTRAISILPQQAFFVGDPYGSTNPWLIAVGQCRCNVSKTFFIFVFGRGRIGTWPRTDNTFTKNRRLLL